jgi:heme-degrading monooxygenase HmoA
VHARVSTYELSAEKLDDGVRGFREAIDRIRSLDGFQEAYLLVDREHGQAITITVWDGAHSMEASRVPASRARSEAARAADGEVKSSGEYEIALHERGAHVEI